MRKLTAILLLCAVPALAESAAERRARQDAEAAARKAEQQMKAAISVNKRAYGQGKYALDLDNVKCGWVANVDGGHAVADVVTERLGADGVAKKHVGNVKYEEISFRVGPDTAHFIDDWQGETAMMKPHSGVLTRFGENGLPVETIRFSNALLSEIGLPAVTAGAADRNGLVVKLAPEFTQVSFTPEGAPLPAPGPDYPRLAGKRRGNVASVRALLHRQGKSTPLTLSGFAGQGIAFSAVDASDGARDSVKVPGRIEYPNIALTLAESSAKPLYDWHESFVVKGQSTDADEGTLVVEFLRRDGEVLWTATYANVGPLSVTLASGDGKAEPTVTAVLYAEDGLVSSGSVPPPADPDQDDPEAE